MGAPLFASGGEEAISWHNERALMKVATLLLSGQAASTAHSGLAGPESKRRGCQYRVKTPSSCQSGERKCRAKPARFGLLEFQDLCISASGFVSFCT